MSPLPTFANSREVGVSGMPMSAIFFCVVKLSLHTYLFLLNHCIEYLIFVICKENVLHKKIIFYSI